MNFRNWWLSITLDMYFWVVHWPGRSPCFGLLLGETKIGKAADFSTKIKKVWLCRHPMFDGLWLGKWFETVGRSINWGNGWISGKMELEANFARGSLSSPSENGMVFLSRWFYNKIPKMNQIEMYVRTFLFYGKYLSIKGKYICESFCRSAICQRDSQMRVISPQL